MQIEDKGIMFLDIGMCGIKVTGIQGNLTKRLGRG